MKVMWFLKNSACVRNPKWRSKSGSATVIRVGDLTQTPAQSQCPSKPPHFIGGVLRSKCRMEEMKAPAEPPVLKRSRRIAPCLTVTQYEHGLMDVTAIVSCFSTSECRGITIKVLASFDGNFDEPVCSLSGNLARAFLKRILLSDLWSQAKVLSITA